MKKLLVALALLLFPTLVLAEPIRQRGSLQVRERSLVEDFNMFQIRNLANVVVFNIDHNGNVTFSGTCTDCGGGVPDPLTVGFLTVSTNLSVVGDAEFADGTGIGWLGDGFITADQNLSLQANETLTLRSGTGFNLDFGTQGFPSSYISGVDGSFNVNADLNVVGVTTVDDLTVTGTCTGCGGTFSDPYTPPSGTFTVLGDFTAGNAGGGGYIRTAGSMIFGKTDGGGDTTGLQVDEVNVTILLHDIGLGMGELILNGEFGNILTIGASGTTTTIAVPAVSPSDILVISATDAGGTDSMTFNSAVNGGIVSNVNIVGQHDWQIGGTRRMRLGVSGTEMFLNFNEDNDEILYNLTGSGYYFQTAVGNSFNMQMGAATTEWSFFGGATATIRANADTDEEIENNAGTGWSYQTGAANTHAFTIAGVPEFTISATAVTATGALQFTDANVSVSETGTNDLLLNAAGNSVYFSYDGTATAWSLGSEATTFILYDPQGNDGVLFADAGTTINMSVDGSVSADTLTSTVATGTAPLIVASTTLVANLNADLLDGLDSTAFLTSGGAIAVSTLTVGGGATVVKIQKTVTSSVDLGAAAADTCTAETNFSVPGVAAGDSCTVATLVAIEATAFIPCRTLTDNVALKYCTVGGAADPPSQVFHITTIEY